MEEELKKELQEELKEEGQPTEEKTQEESKETEKVDYKKAFETTLYQKKKYREEAERLKKQLTEMEKKIEEYKNLIEKSEDAKRELEWKEKIEFLTKHRDIDPDFVEEIVSPYAKAKGISLEEALKDSLVKTALEKKQEEKAKEKKTLPPSGKVSIAGKSLGELTREEIRKHYPELKDEIISKLRRQPFIK